MTEQQQAACAELARMIGWRAIQYHHVGIGSRWTLVSPDANKVLRGYGSEPDAWAEAPNYFTDPVASRELVAWLASDDDYWRKFTYELFGKAEIKGWDYVRAGMTADLPIIARAACKALGIEVE